MLVVTSLTLLGCDATVRVDLARNSTVGKMRFTTSEFSGRRGRLRNLSFVSIIPCLGSNMEPDTTRGWILARPVGDDAPAVTEFTYGVVPNGWTVHRPATPLSPGCYQISVQLTDRRPGGTEVIVDSTGSVRLANER